MNNKQFEFNISLSVLNHLGRNLYRNIITIIGEAISNAWDADAKNVKLVIDKENNNMFILDDGIGMTEDDFQHKFLKIGYSKRNGDNFFTKSGRPFIGRKGIGKLALLSCAKRIHIITKTTGTSYIGGVIDNTKLDEAITEDSEKYSLESYNTQLEEKMNGMKSGTLIFFENVNNGIYNSVEYLKSAIALNFKFSLLDNSFNLYVNDDLITEKKLTDLADKTQFIWFINSCTDPYINMLKKIKTQQTIDSKFNITGYIATVDKPSSRTVRGTDEKATLDLFVNGRLRERDLLRHTSKSRIVENYVYGQIHYNDLDNGSSPDIFTSSREGIVPESQEYINFIAEVNRLYAIIIDRWDKCRLQNGDDGDSDNVRVSPKERKVKSLLYETIKEFNGEKLAKNKIVNMWEKKLLSEAKFNVSTYIECFLTENLFRNYIEYKNISIDGKDANAEFDRCKKQETDSKAKANIYFDIRQRSNKINYLGMDNLAGAIDSPEDRQNNRGFLVSAKAYKPIRDAVAHSALITPIAKQKLNTEFENIKAHLSELLENVDEKE